MSLCVCVCYREKKEPAASVLKQKEAVLKQKETVLKQKGAVSL